MKVLEDAACGRDSADRLEDIRRKREEAGSEEANTADKMKRKS